MKEIPLSRGKVALVDDEDYEWLMKRKWRTHKSNGNRWYAVCSNPSKQMHREILNAPSGVLVDHKNGNGLDNRRENIRLCTHKQNSQNRRMSKNNRLGLKGVLRQSGKYVARIRVDGKLIYIGRFPTPIDAARAYDDMARRNFGEFAGLNFPNGVGDAR